jgi:hypothetical protein
VPIVIAAALRGQSPLTTAATAGMQMALTAVGLASMAGTRIAGHAVAAGRSTQGGADSEDGGEDESAGIAPQPSTTPTTGSSTTPASAQRSPSSEATAESPATRQSRILSGYDNSGLLEDEQQALI